MPSLRKATRPNLTWPQVRAAIDMHEDALRSAYTNIHVLHDAIGYQSVNNAHTTTFSRLTLWGRLRWLLTGRLA